MAKLSYIALSALVVIFAPVARGCETNRVENFSAEFRGSLNSDFNDYGLLAIDAGTTECVDMARARLLEKVRNTLAFEQHLDERKEVVGPYAGWLEGAQVALIFAAGMEIYGLGALDSETDAALQQVRDAYTFRRDPHCGFSGSNWQNYNTCMDDLSVAASAYGWIAAYEHRRGRERLPHADVAVQMISRSLDSNESICMHNPAREFPSACNATHQDLSSRAAVMISLNHGQQTIPYGFGLMTSVAAAKLGLQYAEWPYELTPRERLVALALLDEARAKTHDSGEHFTNDCAMNLRFENGRWRRDDVADCGEALGYRPRMYPLFTFYEREVATPAQGTINHSPVPSGRYIFHQFDPALFSFSPTAFHNAGRLVTYGLLADRWWRTPPVMPEVGKPLDDHEPVGEASHVGTRQLACWACDPDSPSSPLRIELFTTPDAEPGTSIGYVMADEPDDERSISTACGGVPHRFLVTWTEEIGPTRAYAFAVDATGRGMTRLGSAGPRRRPAGLL